MSPRGWVRHVGRCRILLGKAFRIVRPGAGLRCVSRGWAKRRQRFRGQNGKSPSTYQPSVRTSIVTGLRRTSQPRYSSNGTTCQQTLSLHGH